MSNPTRSDRLVRFPGSRLLATAFLAASVGFIASCDCESCKTPDAGDKITSGTSAPAGNTPAPAATDAPRPDAVYVVRGQVVELPDPKDPAKEFRVHHEAIDDFKGSDGKVVGMGSMEMFFPLKDNSLIADVKVGDILELTFEDYYSPRRKYFVTKIAKLPADTKLEFREANVAK